MQDRLFAPWGAALLAAVVFSLGLASGCRHAGPHVLKPDESGFTDPLLGHHKAGPALDLPNNEVLRQFFDEAGVNVLNRETAADVPALLSRVDSKGPHLLLVRSISAHDISEQDAALLRQWVRDGGILWLRANSSLETWFGVEWRALPKYNLLDRRLLRDREEIANHYLTRGVRSLRIVGLGRYLPMTDQAKAGWEDVLRTARGCVFGVLRYGAGRILFDSATVDPEERNPFFGIYGFDADVFWANFLAYTGIMKPEADFKALLPPTPAPVGKTVPTDKPEKTPAHAP